MMLDLAEKLKDFQFFLISTKLGTKMTEVIILSVLPYFDLGIFFRGLLNGFLSVLPYFDFTWIIT